MPNERAIGNIEIVESSTSFNSKNYLLAIGIDKYADTKIKNLNTAVDDVEKIAALLVNKFGFEHRPEYLLFNEAATKQNINNAFVKLLELFDKNPNQDNLIVYFAGHGDYDKRFDIGYRIPTEAILSQDSTYIEDSAILDRIKRLKAKHVLLISDSCFSGSMVRSLDTEQYTFEEKSEALPSRHILTSGLLEEVDDGFRNDNSPFAKSILNYLQAENRLFIPFSDVAQFVKKAVPQNSQQNQVPYYGKLKTQGDFFGEFVLRTKNVELSAWNALDKNSLSALTAFIAKYPESLKLAEAQKNIDRIKAEVKQRTLDAEKRAYENAKTTPTIYNLNQFIKDYPTSSFTSEIEDLLADAEENAAWKEAKNKNTITGFRLFLRNFPNTNLKDDAQKRIEKIENDVDSNEVERLYRIKNEERERQSLEKIETDKLERERLAKLETDKIERQRLEKLEIAKQAQEFKAKMITPNKESEQIVKLKTPQLKQTQTQKISTKTITWSSVFTFLAFAAYMAFKFGFFAPKPESKSAFPSYLKLKDTAELPILIKPNYTTINKFISIEPEMIFVQGGTFKMGSNDGDANEKPVHSVTVSDFNIGKYEITVAQFDAFIKDRNYITTAEKEGSSYIWDGKTFIDKKGVFWKHDVNGNVRPQSEYNHPVIHVSWIDAKAYCDWLSEKKGKKYRLPTEAEWEFAARGGNESKNYMYSGSNSFSDVAWEYNNSNNKTHAIGSLQANELGIYDMSGNVYEWCWDFYNGDYTIKSPTLGSTEGKPRVLRGGSWFSYSSICRVASRDKFIPTNHNYYIGFRVARYN